MQKRSESEVKDRNSSAKPVIIFDGECWFCRRWIAVWQRCTGERVEYVASQEPTVRERFPELREEEFGRAVQLVDADGKVYSGAEAVFRALALVEGKGGWLWMYEKVPGFATVSEGVYGIIARQRIFFSKLTRLFLPPEPARFELVRSLFLRGLGVVYLLAFGSLLVQVIGLVGSNGILPVEQLMGAAEEQLTGTERWRKLPTLCWWSASDGFLRGQCLAGMALGGMMIAGVIPALAAFGAWALYLSLCVAGRDFLGFQWDNLLLEAGLLAIFFAPWRLRLSGGERAGLLMVWLYRWLIFRLMFQSGVVKLTSGDPAWASLTALQFHYETQPLPTPLGYYAHFLPDWLHQFSVAGMFVVELVVPFFVFGPWYLRVVAFAAFVGLQAGIALTGNYAFFNLLTVLLCLPLLHDQLLARWAPGKVREWLARKVESRSGGGEIAGFWKLARGAGSWVRGIALVGVVTVVLGVSILYLVVMFKRGWDIPGPIVAMYQMSSPFRSVNSYGLFAVMTTSRPEIIIEGSNDGENWLPYEFRYKAGELAERPKWAAPHQPRLDWQMWFAALGSIQQNRWFVNLCLRLLQGSPEVLELLEKNPFPVKPPKYVRAVLYEYRFARKGSKEWWQREFKGMYLQPVGMDGAMR